MKVDWLRKAKYSKEYVTDDILVIDRKRIYVEDGYRPITIDRKRIDELFKLKPISQINTNSKITRTYANNTITRYRVGSSYVILNDEYRYIWKNRYLFTLQPSNDIQYRGPIGILDEYGLVGILSPIIIEPHNLDNPNYWVNIDEMIK